MIRKGAAMRKTLVSIITLLLLFCVVILSAGEVKVQAATSYDVVSELFDKYYHGDSFDSPKLCIDETGYGEFNLKPDLPEGYIYVDEIGPSQSGVVQIKFTSTLDSKDSYLSIDDNVLRCNYSGNIEEILEDSAEVSINVQTDARFSLSYGGLDFEIARAKAQINGETRVREGEVISFSLELQGYSTDDISWVSSDNSVLRLLDDSDKLRPVFKGLAPGKSSVSAMIVGKRGMVSAERPVIVTERELGFLNIPKATLYTGESVVLEISNLPEGATVTYSSSAKSKVKADKKSGRITALKKGSATVTAKIKVPASDEGKAYSYTLKSKIKVKEAKAVSITSLKQLQNVLTDKKGGKYKLGADIEGLSNITVTKGTYRLDLNGHIVSGENTKNSLIMVSGGNLTLTDSKGGGKIVNHKDQDAIGCEKGKLSVYGGEYIGLAFSVFMEGSGTLNFYGGKLTGVCMALCVHSGNVNLYGGTFTQTSADFWGTIPINVLEVRSYDPKNPVNMTIYGGSYTANLGSVVDINGPEANVVINGGFFESGICDVFDQWGGNTVINGGEFYYSRAKKEDRGCVLAIGNMRDACSVTINDGIFRNRQDHIFFIQNTPDIFINGGRFIIENGADNEYYKEPYIDIVETFDGTLYIEPGLIDDDRIHDDTPKGKGLIATEFTRNKTKYKEGMKIEDPDDLYSAMMDATENLSPDFKITCSYDLYKVLLHYSNHWNSGMKNLNFTWEETKENNSKLYNVTMTITYQFEYEIEMASYSAEAEKRASKEAKAYSKKIDKIVSSVIKKGMSDREKAIALHDYMVKNYSYDHDFAADSYRIFGLLDNNKGVCQAYANLYRILSNRAGLDCYCVTGIGGDPGKTDLHMWNCIKIDDKWLYIDVTFDDSSGTKNWLLKDEEEFFKFGKHAFLA